MAGRHRAPSSPSWKLPTTIGATAAGLLISTVWATSGGEPTVEDSAAGQLVAELPASQTSKTEASATSTTTTTRTTTRSATPTSSKTTAKRATTTRATTTRRPSPKPSPPPAPPPASCSTELAGTQPHVAQVGNHILSKFDVDSVGGRADRSGTSDHPDGLALDFMVDTATGNALADYVLANQSAFGGKYVIWRQRYNDGGGWSMMADRGGVTANHYDHVHVSFYADANVSVTC